MQKFARLITFLTLFSNFTLLAQAPQEDHLKYECDAYLTVYSNFLNEPMQIGVPPTVSYTNKAHLQDQKTSEAAKLDGKRDAIIAGTYLQNYDCNWTENVDRPVGFCPAKETFQVEIFSPSWDIHNTPEQIAQDKYYYDSIMSSACKTNPNCIAISLEMTEKSYLFSTYPNLVDCAVINDRDKDEVPDGIDQCDGIIGTFQNTDVYDEFYEDVTKRGCRITNQCAIGEERINGICKLNCKIFEVRNQAGNCIEKTCSNNMKLNKLTGQCDCAVGDILILGECRKQCTADEVLIGNQCVQQCPALTELNADETECICTLQDVNPLVGERVKEIENIVKASPTKSYNVDPPGPYPNKITFDMISGKDCIQNKLMDIYKTNFGMLGAAKPTITSVYRPQEYQDHFADIMKKYDAMLFAKKKHKIPDQCKAIVANILYEKDKVHGIKEASYSVSNHTLSKAFDMTWNFGTPIYPRPLDYNIDAIAQSCGLCRPMPDLSDQKSGMKIKPGKTDGVHFEPITMHGPKSFGYCGKFNGK